MGINILFFFERTAWLALSFYYILGGSSCTLSVWFNESRTHAQLCVWMPRREHRAQTWQPEAVGDSEADSEDTAAGRRFLLLPVYSWFQLPQTSAQLASKAFQGEWRADGVNLASHICISFRNPWELYLSKAKGRFYWWSLRQNQKFFWHTKLSPKPSNHNEDALWGRHEFSSTRNP